MAKINLTISGLKEAKADLAELNKEFEKVKDDPIKSKKLAKEFNALSKEIDEATESLTQMNSAGQLLGVKFDDLNEVLFGFGEGTVLPLSSQIGEMEDRMYQLAAAGQAGNEEFQALTKETARLRTVIRETDKQVDLLAENKGLSVFGTGIAQIGDSILRLDFETASKDAQALNNAVGSLSKMGTQAITGLVKTVAQLSKAFITMGVALLANPIFLIATAITALIAVVATLGDKISFLKPLFDGLGVVVGAVRDAVNYLVQSIKDLLDALGLTSYAMDELKDKTIEAWDKIGAKAKEIQDRRVDDLDKQIKLEQIAGNNTIDLEIEKQEVIKQTSEVEAQALEAKIKDAELRGTLDEKEIADQREKLKNVRKLIKDSEFEIKVIKAQADKDEKNRLDEERKTAQENYKKKLEDEKAYQKQRLDVARDMEDLKLELMKDGIEKELLENKYKYERLIADTMSNEELTFAEKENLREIYAELQFNREKEIRFAQDAELKALTEATTAEREAKQKEADEKRREAQISANQKMYDDYKAYAQATIEADRAVFDAKLGLAKGLVSGLSELAGENEKAQNAFFLVDKALAIGEVIVNTQREIAGYFASYAAIPGGAAIAATQAVAAKIRAATSIATIVASSIAKFKGGGGGGSVGGSVGGGGGATATATQPATPNYEFFGQNNNANNLSSPQDVEQSITVKAVVSESEVTATQDKIKKITENATL